MKLCNLLYCVQFYTTMQDCIKLCILVYMLQSLGERSLRRLNVKMLECTPPGNESQRPLPLRVGHPMATGGDLKFCRASWLHQTQDSLGILLVFSYANEYPFLNFDASGNLSPEFSAEVNSHSQFMTSNEQPIARKIPSDILKYETIKRLQVVVN